MKRPAKIKRVSPLRRAAREEWVLGVSLVTCAIFAASGERIFDRLDNPLWLAAILLWLPRWRGTPITSPNCSASPTARWS
jgi:hypothetical protein